MALALNTDRQTDRQTHTQTDGQVERQTEIWKLYKGPSMQTNQLRHEISNNAICATSKGSNQPAHTRSLIRALASRLKLPTEHPLEFLLRRLTNIYTYRNATLLKITCHGSI